MELARNKKAYFDYEILEILEVGIMLSGAEVKSVRGKQMSLAESYVRIDNSELFLWNADISKYRFADIRNYDPIRTRKLLASKSEILRLESKMKQGRLTLIPLKAYTKGKLIKMEIGLCRGRKRYEKKQREKERDMNREFHRDKREIMV